MLIGARGSAHHHDKDGAETRAVALSGGDTLFIDEVFVGIQGKQNYLWRAVDQDGEVVDAH